MGHIGRREVIAGAVLAGTAATSRAEGRQDEALLREIRDELRTLRQSIGSPPTEVALVRNVQHTYLRAAGKYPEVIEVGTRIFDAIHDWLRQTPQRLEISRLADGRYALRFDFTTLVLRPDAQPDYLGPPADGR